MEDQTFTQAGTANWMLITMTLILGGLKAAGGAPWPWWLIVLPSLMALGVCLYSLALFTYTITRIMMQVHRHDH